MTTATPFVAAIFFGAFVAFPAYLAGSQFAAAARLHSAPGRIDRAHYWFWTVVFGAIAFASRGNLAEAAADVASLRGGAAGILAAHSVGIPWALGQTMGRIFRVTKAMQFLENHGFAAAGETAAWDWMIRRLDEGPSIIYFREGPRFLRGLLQEIDHGRTQLLVNQVQMQSASGAWEPVLDVSHAVVMVESGTGLLIMDPSEWAIESATTDGADS